MPTLIDELVVTLGLDSSKLVGDVRQVQAQVNVAGAITLKASKELEEALRKQQNQTTSRLKQTEQIGRQTYQQFNRLRLEVLALFSSLATGYGIQQFVRSITTSEASVGRLSKAIGNISTEDVSAFEQASERMGGSAEAAGQSMLGFSQALERMRITGEAAPFMPILRRMHIDLAEANGQARPLMAIMRDISGWMSQHQGPEAQAAGNMLGFDQGTINLLSSGKLEEAMRRVKAIGVMNAGDAALAQTFVETLHDFEQTLTRLGQVLANDYLPDITKALNGMTAWATANRDWIKADIEEKLTAAIKYVKEFLAAVNDVVKAVGGWQTTLEIVFGLWAAAKVAPILSAIGSITTALGKGPTGLLGTLLLIETTLSAVQRAMQNIEMKGLAPNSPLWENVPEEEQLKYPQSPASRRRSGQLGNNPNPFSWWNPGSWLDRPASGLADTTMDDIKRGFLNTLAMPESGGAYDVKNGGSKFSDFSRFPEGIGPGGTSSAAGRYQFTSDTWRQMQQKYGFADFSPQNQDKAAWALASERYGMNTNGRDLEGDLRAGGHAADIAKALRDTWPSLPGGSQSTQGLDVFDAALQKNMSGMPMTPSKGMMDSIKGLFHRPSYSPPSSYDPSLSQIMSTPTAAAISQNNSRTSSLSNETHVGSIVINTSATDTDAIARGVGASLRKYAFVSNANYGLS